MEAVGDGDLLVEGVLHAVTNSTPAQAPHTGWVGGGEG
jgi:hypothetical protein